MTRGSSRSKALALGVEWSSNVLVTILKNVMVRVGMASAPSGQVGLQCHNNQRRDHRNQARKRSIPLAEDIWKTRIGQRCECRREQVDKGCREENAGSEMLT